MYIQGKLLLFFVAWFKESTWEHKTHSVPNALQALVAVNHQWLQGRWCYHDLMAGPALLPPSSPLHLQIANFSSKCWNNFSFLMLYELSNHGGQNGRVGFFPDFILKWILSFDNLNQRIWLAKWQAREENIKPPQCVVTCRTMCRKLATSTTSRVSKQCILILIESLWWWRRFRE